MNRRVNLSTLKRPKENRPFVGSWLDIVGTLSEKGPNKKTKIVTKSTYIMDEFVKVKTIITLIR